MVFSWIPKFFDKKIYKYSAYTSPYMKKHKYTANWIPLQANRSNSHSGFLSHRWHNEAEQPNFSTGGSKSRSHLLSPVSHAQGRHAESRSAAPRGLCSFPNSPEPNRWTLALTPTYERQRAAATVADRRLGRAPAARAGGSRLPPSASSRTTRQALKQFQFMLRFIF